MNTWTACLLLALGTAGAWWSAHAQSADSSIVKLPQDITYKGLPGAPQHVTLFGNSSQPGLYVDRIRFPPGMKVMPHWHPDTVRTVLVMSGTFYFAVGEQWDESKLKAYPAGTLYSEPAKTPHFAWAKDGEVILQVTAIGPTGNTPNSTEAMRPRKPDVPGCDERARTGSGSGGCHRSSGRRTFSGRAPSLTTEVEQKRDVRSRQAPAPELGTPS